MPDFPNRRLWRKSTNSHFNFPGIAPVRVAVGSEITVRNVESEVLQYFDQDSPKLQRYVVLAVREFKDGRRWSVVPIGGDDGRMFLHERDILEQVGPSEIVVGLPWNYPKFNPSHFANFQPTPVF